MKYLIIIIIGLTTLSFFYSCNSTPSSQIKFGNNIKAREIFAKKYYLEEPFVQSYKISDKEFIFGFNSDYENTTFSVLSSFANSWNEDFQYIYADEYYYTDSIHYSEDNYSSVGVYDTIKQNEIVELDNNIYLFYYLGAFANSMRFNFVFALYDITNQNHAYIKVFNTFPNTEDIKYEFSEGLDKKNNIKTYLEKKIKSVFVKSEVKFEDGNSYEPSDLWMAKNGSVYENINQSSKYFPLKFISISEDIVNEDLPQSEKIFSNNEFDLYSRFKGPLYLYEKEKETYTIIWYPESPYDWIQSCEYKNNHLYLFPQMQKFYYALNLITNKIRKINE